MYTLYTPREHPVNTLYTPGEHPVHPVNTLYAILYTLYTLGVYRVYTLGVVERLPVGRGETSPASQALPDDRPVRSRRWRQDRHARLVRKFGALLLVAATAGHDEVHR